MSKKWTFYEKLFFAVFTCIGLLLSAGMPTEAMHIMEGYLPLMHCMLWFALCIPFLGLSILHIQRLVRDKPRTLILLAMSGAFIFVLSSLKIPSVTGSCSHMTGTGLSAILFGPVVPGILGIIVLIFQALLLAHGGITTLGANTFSMAIGGPVITWALYRLGQKMSLNKKVNIFIAAAFGDLLTYCITSAQLAFAFPDASGGMMMSLIKFLGVFAPTQLPLAIIEGLLTVMIIVGMESFAKPELQELGYVGGSKS